MSIRQIKGLQSAKLAVGSNTKVAVKFYAPWCGACKKIEPIYATLPSKHKDIKFYAVNIDVKQNKELLESYDIQYVPAILFYKNMKLKNRVDGSDKDEIETATEKL